MLHQHTSHPYTNRSVSLELDGQQLDNLCWNDFTRYPAVLDLLIERGCMVHA
ncbi:hypothetical protein [Serratia rhizosphaerae]|uniref:hypothetical protein n=1 Tax=Serratia rhizosphaerae TaxID=2597702 RepID=UPI002DB86736|nr:hypothetical protein [Serratia rhizosphaerae]MEB6337925.1 hypothetical protein [Serratia rhizosphaerae]